MTAFHSIAIPHEDILQGRSTMDVFAADLLDVYKDRGSEEYRNTGLFFKKTHQTEGLTNLLEVLNRASGVRTATPSFSSKPHLTAARPMP